MGILLSAIEAPADQETPDRQRIDSCHLIEFGLNDPAIMRRGSTVQNAQYDATCVGIWTAKITQGFQALEIWLRLTHGWRLSRLRDHY